MKEIFFRIIYRILINIIIIYQKVLSPIFPARCRYYPTCSTYGLHALQWHGVQDGSWLLLKRLSRCQPFGGHGIDFVPVPLSSYTYYYVSEPDMNANYDDAESAMFTKSSVYRDTNGYTARLNHLLNAKLR